MDVKAVEAILAEVGKIFRLSRMYPASHPAVQHALAELTNSLTALATTGAVELRVSPGGLSLGTAQLASRNPPLQELAGLLYAQGYRSVLLEPGLTADEVSALVRALGRAGRGVTALGAATAIPNLPHLHLAKSAGRASSQRGVEVTRDVLEIAPVLSRRSTGEFRPDALPPDIEAKRLVPMAELAAAAEAPRMLGRLGELAQSLLSTGEYVTLVEVLRVLTSAARRPEPEVVHAARTALERIPDAMLGAMVNLLDDPKLCPADRDKLANALGLLGGRAIPVAVDSFLTSTEP
ncbi:MAG TPA: hypothetical protein VNL98_11125, partial [Gemmatimonadales bacterium]|nr:hypothetical protein [Gemmatimonadales bacterium]